MTTTLPKTKARARLDLLKIPGVGQFVRWRYSRLILQVPLLLLALLAAFDGFTGQQIAGKNLATVSTWLHYRGLVVLSVLLVGNLFCAACPLMLTRGPSKLLKRVLPEFRWPRAIKNKYFTVGLLVTYLFAYEYFGLWASPWLSAWLIVGYFGAALLIDTFYPAGTFCKYVCPLGNFNFALSSAAPTQITAKDPEVCSSCTGKYCLNGRIEERGSGPAQEVPSLGQDSGGAGGQSESLNFESLAPLPLLETGGPRTQSVQSRPERLKKVSSDDFNTRRDFQLYPGCETKLYVPQISSNTDCTLCLNCVRACPYDNIALEVRPAARSWESSKPRADWALYGVVLFFGGLFNALAMTEPFFKFAAWLSHTLNSRVEFLLLLTILSGIVGLGTLLALWILRSSSALLGFKERSSAALRRWGWVFFPLTLAMWAGHYSYHFLTGWASIVPTVQNALERLGLYSGVVNWQLAGLIPENWLFPTQVLIMYAGYSAALFIAFRVAWKEHKLSSALPLFALLTVLSILVLLVLAQPMQARGTLLAN